MFATYNKCRILSDYKLDHSDFKYFAGGWQADSRRVQVNSETKGGRKHFKMWSAQNAGFDLWLGLFCLEIPSGCMGSVQKRWLFPTCVSLIGDYEMVL